MLIKYFRNRKLKKFRSQILDWQKGDRILIWRDSYSASYGFLVAWDNINVIMCKYAPNKKLDYRKYDLKDFLKSNLQDVIIAKLYKIERNESYLERQELAKKRHLIESMEESLKLREEFQQHYEQALKELNEKPKEKMRVITYEDTEYAQQNSKGMQMLF